VSRASRERPREAARRPAQPAPAKRAARVELPEVKLTPAWSAAVAGVLEPPQAQPVIVEDDCFVGSRAIVVEGVHVGAAAVLGAGVVLTASTPIVDVTGTEPRVTRGRIPPRAVVIPGSMPKAFPAGTFGTPCALVIGQRSDSTDRKTSLNQALREHGVAV